MLRFPRGVDHTACQQPGLGLPSPPPLPVVTRPPVGQAWSATGQGPARPLWPMGLRLARTGPAAPGPGVRAGSPRSCPCPPGPFRSPEGGAGKGPEVPSQQLLREFCEFYFLPPNLRLAVIGRTQPFRGHREAFMK